MKNKDKTNQNQLSLFDIQPDEIEKQLDNFSVKDLKSIIREAQDKLKAKEAEEKAEAERRRAEKKQREEAEEQRRREERIAEATCMDLPLDWNNLYADDARASGIYSASISDGLILSLNTLGAVDIEYIAQVSGYSYKDVIETLQGSIYQNPVRWGECFYKGWETADEYLSGNLLHKYKAAGEANETYNGHFAANLRAIEAVLPEPIRTDEIYVTLGSPWVPPDVIDEFIKYLLGYRNARTFYEPVTCTWEISDKSSIYNVKTTKTYGTERMSALHIIEKTLNMKTLQIFDKKHSQTTKSGEKLVLNKNETVAVQEKQQLIIQKFREWIWAQEFREWVRDNDDGIDIFRKDRLKAIYEDKFGCVRQRKFDGGFLELPGLSPDIVLYPYQKNAVARILFSPNTLLAHDMGAGKTYIMVAAGMELRRMGISRKNVYVVPNNIVSQWQSFFLQLYPQAKLLIVEPKVFTPKKRRKMLETIRDGDFDAVIIAYSCFDLIPLSRHYYREELEQELKIIEKALRARTAALLLNNKNLNNKNLKNRKNTIKKKLAEIELALAAQIPAVCFDDLGINTLFVDEAHNFKNISIDTKIDKVLGISKSGSGKCNAMLDKVRCVQQTNNGRGAVFATGTPITNSVTDIFVMQTYLQYGELKFLDLHHFDNWAANFGEKKTEFEIDVDTSAYRLATRFSKFHNLPELTNLLAQVADFHKADGGGELPQFDGYDDKLIAKTAALGDYIETISERAEMIRNGLVNRADDNMLKLTTDGRKAALDMRLADPQEVFTYDCKVFRCMENVRSIYRATASRRLTQLIFCDSSTPKAGFNIYDELKQLLIYYGVAAADIAFVHDYKTEIRRAQLFAQMRNGIIRVLLGSTFKLGMGVNVQDKLVAVHHLDVPWRPADMVQREGRILRQGNENEKVQIFRYITDGSFDAYSWQLLESKQRFITQLLSGSVTERSASDVDDAVLNYAEVKALAIGNPLLKERVETDNELKRHCILQRKWVEARAAMQEELHAIPGKLAHTQTLLKSAMSDKRRYAKHGVEIKEMKGHREYGALILQALDSHVMQPEQKTLFQYQGFDIVLPSHMLREKPAAWIVGSGRYYVELGDSDIGCIKRVDNKLDSFDAFIKEQRQELENLITRQKDMEAELEKEQSYDTAIETLRRKLEKIDKKLV